MARLVLVRHAKAADGDVDRERPLTATGQRDAAALGGYLGSLPLTPDRVVVSPSRRAVQTWQRLGIAGTPEEDARVYDNTVEALLAVITESPPDVKTLVVVGHNPSISELAQLLDDGRGDPSATAALRRGFPAGTAAVFTTSGPFAEVRPAGASLTDFRAPSG